MNALSELKELQEVNVLNGFIRRLTEETAKATWACWVVLLLYDRLVHHKITASNCSVLYNLHEGAITQNLNTFCPTRTLIQHIENSSSCSQCTGQHTRRNKFKIFLSIHHHQSKICTSHGKQKRLSNLHHSKNMFYSAKRNVKAFCSSVSGFRHWRL